MGADGHQVAWLVETPNLKREQHGGSDQYALVDAPEGTEARKTPSSVEEGRAVCTIPDR